MKERPILFSKLMVQAILKGQKTQTRRKVKGVHLTCIDMRTKEDVTARHIESLGCPYGYPGDRLWVRETWAKEEHEGKAVYRATDEGHFPIVDGRWKPSIHMPRWASRITLEIVAVRVERLTQMQAHDAMREGVHWNEECGYTVDGIFGDKGNPVTTFYYLWEQINGLGSWQANPWVWVVEFKRV